ncbi:MULTISPECIES: amidohydrolase family protein [Rhodococcus]|jgi:imidazolonepropionase-like amidohydrolase|uniref:Amidohydrolase family protein n=1 Tax=Rhodococcus oxybenzonivorans TaxID=1990687 RepID=A0AAE4UVW6_9NOCA|nr:MULTISPECIES: amidohydrolase family protein [Rhodococcus]MDV7244808.1 amidohydrolase family protein [Rhodococcus oxybenzonivorans]MDV7263607.1 amidohydrolase family protein [Rhodococcus oxybenzonivorans]MDV7275693.1 amidohydrolase family protein [Rhodococcus oxybenzonivorans]MDV7332470.1 amidohydrolase family protein [Rhodococcus oxybenzonivorans]MDV7346266.1 amidohydrolase family protein [Rhodococcus oxybenzonivorans]
MSALHLRGIGLPGEQPVEYWVDQGVVSTEPIAGAETICDSGWIVPGLVDAHCHVGIKFGGGGGESIEGLIAQAETERDAGVLLIRDAGSPVDTRFLDERVDLPRIVRAGQHIAAPKRYIPGLPVDLEDEEQLPAEVARQARAGDGWVKLVGDWIDRSIGDLAPLWSDDILVEAIAAAHREGARVTAHVFAEDALPGLINAGIDCIEHGTGLTDETIELMVGHGTALVPTLINIATFPEIADSATRYPVYAAHMRDLHSRVKDTIGAAHEAGIPIYAGTDAGGSIVHGRIADEVEELKAVGLSPTDALGAACWNARTWLRHPGLEPGAPADLLVYRDDPRTGSDALAAPDIVVLRGNVVKTR